MVGTQVSLLSLKRGRGSGLALTFTGHVLKCWGSGAQTGPYSAKDPNSLHPPETWKPTSLSGRLPDSAMRWKGSKQTQSPCHLLAVTTVATGSFSPIQRGSAED